MEVDGAVGWTVKPWQLAAAHHCHSNAHCPGPGTVLTHRQHNPWVSGTGGPGEGSDFSIET